MKEKLSKFWKENEIPSDNIWRRSAYAQMFFVRDYLCDLLKTECHVISYNDVRSIKLPVYELEFKGITITMCNPFSLWLVSLKSDHPIIIDDEDLIGSSIDKLNFKSHNFEDELIYGEYIPGCTEFSFVTMNDYSLWTLLYKLNKR